MKKIGHFIIGFAAGAATGTVATLLFAPSEGSHLRDKLSYQFSRLKNKVLSLMQKREEMVNDAKLQGDAIVTNTQNEAIKLQNEMDNIGKRIKKTAPISNSTN